MTLARFGNSLLRSGNLLRLCCCGSAPPVCQCPQGLGMPSLGAVRTTTNAPPEFLTQFLLFKSWLYFRDDVPYTPDYVEESPFASRWLGVYHAIQGLPEGAISSECQVPSPGETPVFTTYWGYQRQYTLLLRYFVEEPPDVFTPLSSLSPFFGATIIDDAVDVSSFSFSFNATCRGSFGCPEYGPETVTVTKPVNLVRAKGQSQSCAFDSNYYKNRISPGAMTYDDFMCMLGWNGDIAANPSFDAPQSVSVRKEYTYLYPFPLYTVAKPFTELEFPNIQQKMVNLIGGGDIQVTFTGRGCPGISPENPLP